MNHRKRKRKQANAAAAPMEGRRMEQAKRIVMVERG